MKTLVASSLVLGLLTPAAWASTATTTGPVTLTAAQMDKIMAGASPDDPGYGTFTAFLAGSVIGAPNNADPPGQENQPGEGLRTARGGDLPGQ